MKSKTFFKLLSFLIIVGFFISCSSNQNPNKDQSKINLDIKTKTEKQLNFFSFPSPDEILGIVEQANLRFKYDVINSPDNLSKYSTKSKQVLNLGVYTTDVAYLALFKKKSSIPPLLNAIIDLSLKLKINGAFPKGFIERTFANINNLDSLADRSEQSFHFVSRYLEDNGDKETLGLLTLGTYIESLYIVINSIDSYDENLELIQMISDQKYAFENLNDFIKINVTTEFYLENFEVIGKVNEIFNRMEKIKVSSESKESDDDLLVIGSDYIYRLSEKDFEELKSIIIENRDSIVN
jgi:hypothetical protein